MTTNDKFKHWREKELVLDGKKRPSGKLLAEFLNKKIAEEHGGADKVPAGFKIYQPNIVALEGGYITERGFDKIVDAIYRFLNVKQGYFGPFSNLRKTPERESLLIAAEANFTYKTKMEECQEEVISLLRKTGALENAKFELAQKLLEKETENSRLLQRVYALTAELELLRKKGE